MKSAPQVFQKHFWPNWGNPNLAKNPFSLFLEGQIKPKIVFFHQCIQVLTYLGNRCGGFRVVLLLRYFDLGNSFRVENTKYWRFWVKYSTTIKNILEAWTGGQWCQTQRNFDNFSDLTQKASPRPWAWSFQLVSSLNYNWKMSFAQLLQHFDVNISV